MMIDDHGKPIKVKPERKRRLSLPGRVISLHPSAESQPHDPLEQPLEQKLPLYLKKGWCIFFRNGYVGLSGYATETKKYIPLNDRKKNVLYKDFTNKDGEKKTREYNPREEQIVSIAYIESVGKHGEHIANRWEVKTHWTAQRNLFDDFEPAWKLFLEIERRYDPGKIVWSKLDEYDEFEDY